MNVVTFIMLSELTSTYLISTSVKYDNYTRLNIFISINYIFKYVTYKHIVVLQLSETGVNFSLKIS